MATRDFGYGVDLSRKDVKWRPGAAEYFLANLASPSIKEEYAEFREENPELDDEESADAFVDEYEDSETLESGFEAVIVRSINENECGSRDNFIFDDQCIYVGARIPRNHAEKLVMLTLEDIGRLLAKYLDCEHILENPVTVETLEITE